MNIRSNKGKRVVELHAVDHRTLERADQLCGELADIARDEDAKQARIHLLNLKKKYASVPSDIESE